MLQRAAETVSGDDECNDPAVLLACALGSTGCPAKCADKASEEKKDSTRVIAGDLNVSVVDYSSSVQSAPKGIFVANTLKFDASEKIELDSLTLKRTGLGTQKSISKVWLEKNGVAVTNSASVGSDGLAVLNFKSNRDTISEATEYQLVVELSSSATAGDEFAFELKSVESTAKNTTVSGTTSTYRVSNYSVVALTAKANALNGTAGTPDDQSHFTFVPVAYDLGNASDYVIGEFTLESDSSGDDRDINVKSLTFRNLGTLDFADTFKNVKVYRDSKVVSNNVEVNGKDITVSLDQDSIKANRKAIYTIRAEVASLEDVNKTVQLSLQNTRDIIADEEDTKFRTTISYEFKNGAESSLILNEYKFKGGKVTFESDSNFAKTVNAGIGATDVTVAKGRLVVTEPVELPEISIAYNVTNGWYYKNGTTADTIMNGATDVTATSAIKRLILKIGDKRYTADPANDGTFTFSDVVVRETTDVELLISLGSKVVEGRTIELPNISSTIMSATKYGTYQNNDARLNKGDIAGVIQTANVIVKKPKFTISTSTIDTQETVVNDSTVKTLMKGSLQAKENDVNVNSFEVTLDAVSTAADSDTVEVYLDIDGKSFANSTALSLKNGGTYNFNSIGTIKAGESLPFEIKVVPTVASAGKNIVLTAKAKGTDNNGNDTETSTEYSATLEVKGNATIEVLNVSSVSDRVVEPAANAVIYQGELNVKNGSTTLTSFALTATPGSALNISNYRLYVDGDLVDTQSTPSFTATENLQEGKRKIEVRAKVELKTPTTTTKPEDYTYSTTKVAVNGGTPVDKKATTYFAKGYFALSKTSTNDSVLTVRLTNNSSKTIDVTGITVNDGSTLASASVNNQDVSGISSSSVAGTTVAAQSVAAGDSIEIQLIAAKDSTVKLTGVSYSVTEDSVTYNHVLNSTITSVGAWGQFFSTKG